MKGLEFCDVILAAFFKDQELGIGLLSWVWAGQPLRSLGKALPKRSRGASSTKLSGHVVAGSEGWEGCHAGRCQRLYGAKEAIEDLAFLST